MANWDKVRQKNSVGPALGMAMNKAIDIVIACGMKVEPEEMDAEEKFKKEVLVWRDWIYEENEKKQREVIDSLVEVESGGNNKELPAEKDLF